MSERGCFIVAKLDFSTSRALSLLKALETEKKRLALPMWCFVYPFHEHLSSFQGCADPRF